ncbi:MAG: phage major capsid protein [Maricaulaceae bacterium]|jgi:HK97 family phage major capsid protein
MKKLHEIRRERKAAVDEMRRLHESADGGNLSDEASKRFSELETRVEALNAEEARAEKLADLERRAEARDVSTGLNDYDRARRDFSLVRAIAHMAGVRGVDAGREIEVADQIQKDLGRSTRGLLIPYEVMHTPRRGDVEQRTVTAAGGGAGAIFTEHHPELYTDELVAQAVTGRAGVTTVRGLQGNFAAPANDTGASAQWIGDDEAISPGDIDVNSRTMSPKHLGAIIPFSNSTLLQASPDVEVLARRTFAGQFAAALDSAVLVGGVDDDEPTGVLGTITPGTFATPTWAQGLELIASLATSNALIDDGSLAWIGHPQCSKKLRSTVRVSSTDSRFIMESPRDLYGYSYFNSTALSGDGSPAARAIVFGKWSDALVGIWRDLEILINPFTSDAFTKAGVQIRGLMTADVVLRHEESFAGAVDMNTA